MNFRVRPPRVHRIGPAARDHARRLANREIRRGIRFSDGVVWTLAIHERRNVAGEHVREILEEPDRLNRRDPVAAINPEVEVVGLALLHRHRDRGGDLVQLRRNQPGTQTDSESRRIDTTIDKPGVGHGELRGGHRELNVAGHVLVILAEGLSVLGKSECLLLLFGEAADLATDVVRNPVNHELADFLDAPAALRKRAPKRIQPDADRTDDAQTGDHHTAFGAEHGGVVKLLESVGDGKGSKR